MRRSTFYGTLCKSYFLQNQRRALQPTITTQIQGVRFLSDSSGSSSSSNVRTKKKRVAVSVDNLTKKEEEEASNIAGTSPTAALTISAWFSPPEEGVKDAEILCRSSAFVVRSSEAFQKDNPQTNFKGHSPMRNSLHRPRYHVVTVSHGVAPWLWPTLYPMKENEEHEWLKYINESHTCYTMDLRQTGTGQFATQHLLAPVTYHHSPTGTGTRRDLAVTHFLVDELMHTDRNRPCTAEEMATEEEGIFARLQELGLRVFSMDELATLAEISEAETGRREDKTSGTLQFYGHNVCDLNLDMFERPDRKEDTRVCVPRLVTAALPLLHRSPQQVFARTDDVLVEGMCGGPVLFQAKQPMEKVIRRRLTDRQTVVGMVEGIVPLDHSDENLRAAAVFVEADEILRFLKRVEEGTVKPLVGGQVMLKVGNDQDPDKMDLQKIM